MSAISSFFLAMVTHPEVQKKAQAELDAVVGSTRLPTFSDRPNLPYIDNVLKEVLRWNPLAPLGIFLPPYHLLFHLFLLVLLGICRPPPPGDPRRRLRRLHHSRRGDRHPQHLVRPPFELRPGSRALGLNACEGQCFTTHLYTPTQ